MTEIYSTEPCTGAQGAYEAWLHFAQPTTPDAIPLAQSLRVSLPQHPLTVEQTLDMSDPDPFVILGLVESIPQNEWRSRAAWVPGAITLMRRCATEPHRDNVHKLTRYEIVHRRLLVPKNAGRVAIQSEDIRVNDDGVGVATVREGVKAHAIGPVVRTPRTVHELQMTQAVHTAELVEVLPSGADRAAMYGVVQSDVNGHPLEVVTELADEQLPAL